MSDVPTELYREILIRVPAEPLLRFRCVCKEWRRIIDDPDFGRLHIDRQMGAENMLLIKTEGCDGYSLSLESLIHPESGTRKIKAAHIWNDHPHRRYFDFPVPSCHGLALILYDYSPTPHVLWNPFLGDWLEIPLLNKLVCGPTCVGLGYDGATNDYKVVRIDTSHNLLKTSIYSVKLDEWHMIQDLPCCLHMEDYTIRVGVFMDGVLHWILDVEEGSRKKCILTLDLSTETFNKLPMPPAALSGEGCCELYASAGCLLVNCYEYCMDARTSVSLESIWILQDSGCGKVWTRLISFGNAASFTYEEVSYIKNKEQVLLRSKDCDFLLLDFGKDVGKKISIDGMSDSIFTSQVFPECLIRLTSIANASKEIHKRLMENVGNLKSYSKHELYTSWCWKFLDC